MSDQEEKKTKETDETKETTETATNVTPPEEKTKTEEPITEATSKDSVDALVEKTLAAEKMRPEIKTALVVLVSILLCIVYVYLTAFSDKYLTENVYYSTLFFALIAGVVLAFFGAILLTFSGENYLKLFCIFFLIFIIPAIAFIFPLSKYHNLNQIERDKKIVEALKITVLKDCVEVRLPSEHAEENDYMKKVFSVSWENDAPATWKDTTIPCREGDKYWHKVKLPFPLWYRSKLVGNPFSMMTEKEKKKYENNTDNIVLFFDHAWNDHKETKEISFADPNSL